MDSSGTGKSPNSSLSFRYNANNEELEELFDACEDDPLSPQLEATTSVQSEGASPKKGDKTPSILDKYFKSIRATEKVISEKDKDEKESKTSDESRTPPKEVSSSPMKDYLNRLGKKSVSEAADVRDLGGAHETWRIFQDFKFKIAQAVEDMKTRSLEEPKDKSVLRDNSISDSEDNSAIKDSDLSVGDTDNQVSSLESSMQNLSELSQPVTARATEGKSSFPFEKYESECSDDTQRNLGQSETAALKKEIFEDANMEVESGVEALEDGIDGFSDILLKENVCHPVLGETYSPRTAPDKPPSQNSNTHQSKSNLQRLKDTKPPSPTIFTFTLYFLTFLVFMNYYLFPDSQLWNGFVLGIWVYYIANDIKEYIMETIFGDYEPAKQIQLRRNSSIPSYTIPSVKEHRPVKKYEGWVNHYISPEYDPCTYTLNRTSTAFMKLEGCNLRLSYTRAKIAKREVWDEKIEKVEFYQHSLYNLTGARIILLPKGLVRRRLWSKKYPLCVVLSQNEQIHVLEKENATGKVEKAAEQEKKKEPHDMETETNTSPEKKKKFMWRRRDKSPASLDVEPGKEGLRHRFVSRKKHKDKKSDTVTTGLDSTEPLPVAEKESTNQKLDELPMYDAEQDVSKSNITSSKEKEDVEEDIINDSELSKLKEFLEETELEAGVEGASEGEWSVHIKQTKEPKYSRLYLFTRTGRDKHEWYRRLSVAISGANTANSAETSTSEDKSASDPAQNKDEIKDGIETAVYKVSEKETVAFAKPSNQGKPEGLLGEGPALAGSRPTVSPAPSAPNPFADYDAYEKNFWPFLLKIIETHEVSHRRKSEVGVMCELEPSPRKHSKSKKKPKGSKLVSESRCECRMLPAEVTWLNTVLARGVYDMARNSAVIARLQTRIQNKLATLKLPSFMSPLVVTELSLQGSCPLVERVCAPAWDERGLWLDADLRYDGGAYISILTQINLMKLKEKNVTLEEHLFMGAAFEDTKEQEFLEKPSLADQFTPKLQKHNKPAVYDSDLEDSAESSDEEEPPPPKQSESALQLAQAEQPMTGEVPSSSKKKFMRMVNKIATNKYFQQVTDYKYVKRAMEGLSNTDIKLHLEVQGLEGRVALNLPPPPHDRMWIGFRSNPQLVLKARPAVGQRTLRFAHVTNWIEQKLSKEFEKVLVLPNMEDIMIEVLTPTPVQFE